MECTKASPQASKRHVTPSSILKTVHPLVYGVLHISDVKHLDQGLKIVKHVLRGNRNSGNDIKKSIKKFRQQGQKKRRKLTLNALLNKHSIKTILKPSTKIR